MAKLTKKEIKEMEEMKRAKRSLRREMMDSLQNYWKDVEAMERVYKIQEKPSHLTNEERDNLFNRYEVLKGLTTHQIDALRTLIYNKNEKDRFNRGDQYSQIKEYLPEDAIWISDIVWKEEDLKEQLELFSRIGIEKVYYTDKSTAALRAIVWFTKAGAKISGVTNISEYNEGLIIDLASEVNE